MLGNGKLGSESSARENELLRNSRHTIRPRCPLLPVALLAIDRFLWLRISLNAVKMHCGIKWHEVVHYHLNIVGFLQDKRGPGKLAID